MKKNKNIDRAGRKGSETKPDERRAVTETTSIEHEMQGLFQSLIEHSFDVILVIDSTGKILYISPSVRTILGYEPRDVTGQNALDFVHPDDRKQVRDIIRTIRSTKVKSPYVEVRVLHNNGLWRIVESVANNLFSKTDIGRVVLNYRDITERKQVDESLRRAEKQQSIAFRTCPVSITISDVDDGRFIEVNKGFEKISGYSSEKIIGKTVLDLNLWKNPEQRTLLIELIQKNTFVEEFEADFNTRNGDIRNCLMSAEIVEFDNKPRLIAVTRDITERKRVETLLLETSEQLQREHQELTEKNFTLKQVLDHLENDKSAYRRRLCAEVEKLISPMIAEMRRSGGSLKKRNVDLLETGIQRIIEGELGTFENNVTKLTPRELDICELIKQGLSSKEIADSLELSEQTIHKHRRSIRHKLQLTNKNINLAAYLRLK